MTHQKPKLPAKLEVDVVNERLVIFEFFCFTFFSYESYLGPINDIPIFFGAGSHQRRPGVTEAIQGSQLYGTQWIFKITPITTYNYSQWGL